MSIQAIIRTLRTNGTRVGRFKHSVHVLRISWDDRIVDKLREMASNLGLSVEHIAVSTGLFRKTIRAEVVGPSDSLALYAERLDTFIEEND